MPLLILAGDMNDLLQVFSATSICPVHSHSSSLPKSQTSIILTHSVVLRLDRHYFIEKRPSQMVLETRLEVLQIFQTFACRTHQQPSQ